MTSGIHTIVYPVRDRDAAKALFTALIGDGPHTDQPYYVGFTVDGQEIGLDPNGHAHGQTGPIAYWHVDDLEATMEAVVAKGGTVQQPARDVGGGRRIAVVVDADDNRIGLLQNP